MLQLTVSPTPEFAQVLTPEALAFVEALQRQFGARRLDLLQARRERQARLDAGELPGFLPDSSGVRGGDWRVAPTPPDLQKRWVEITGPTERKMMINALNSGADVFMADCEDANSPNWHNMVQGQLNLRDAVRGTLRFDAPDGRPYTLNAQTAVLLVRPRGWHLDEKHVLLDGAPISGSLFDFGLYFFHNARHLLSRGTGPYFYLPKLESHLEARLWNDVFIAAQDALGIPHGTLRATVLIETILAAFEMEEILYELREHSAGLNAGRWDYIFSIIKKFSRRADSVLPDRAQVTMTVPFMRAYTELLVRSCHAHGAHAIGGMAAFIPNRRDPEVTEVALRRVREDKLRESRDGFDGTWVAHPDLVPVARAVFAEALGTKPHQKERLRDEVRVDAGQLTDFRVPEGYVSEAGVRNNISVAIQYLEAWLRGAGAVAIFNLMEDTATAEIARAQVWQWLHQNEWLHEGHNLTPELYRRLLDEETAKIERAVGAEAFAQGQYARARDLFDRLVTAPQFDEFLTLGAYRELE